MSLIDKLKKLSNDAISEKAEYEGKIIEDVTSYFKNIFESKEFYDELKDACSSPKSLIEKKYTTLVEVSTKAYSLHTYFTIFHYEFNCEKTLSEDLRKDILISIRDMFIKQLLNLGFRVNTIMDSFYKYRIEISW